MMIPSIALLPLLPLALYVSQRIGEADERKKIRRAIEREKLRATIGQAVILHEEREVTYTPAGWGGADAITLDRFSSVDLAILKAVGLDDFTGCRQNATSGKDKNG